MTAPARPLVLHVIHTLRTGGLENGLVNLINTMPREQFAYAIACIEDYSDFRDRLEDKTVEVVALHRSRIGTWRLRRSLFALCRRLQPAIVHTHNLSGLDALVPARVAGVPANIHGEHGWDVGDLTGTARRPALLRRLHAPFVDRYVAVSKDLERYLVERVGIAPARIAVICNGVDTTRFAPGGTPGHPVLPDGFAPPGTVVIGTVGRIQAVKDQATLLRAFAALAAVQPAVAAQARLAIVGDGPLLAELRTLATTLGVEALTWLPGNRTDVPAVLRAFDVFVLPSLNEGISNTILEAMATGLPVVASAVGGNVELVADGDTGMLFPAGDVAALARVLGRLLAEPDRRAAQGRRARAAAIDRFSLAGMVAAYQAVYAACAPHRPGATG